MSNAEFTHHQPVGPDESQLPKWPETGVVFWTKLKPLLDQLVKASQCNLEICGVTDSEKTPEGVFFKIAGLDLLDHAWRFKEIEGVFSIMGGSYADRHLEPMELGGDTKGVVYLQATWDVTDVLDGALLSATLEDVQMYWLDGAVPESAPADGIWNIPLGQFKNGTVLSQDRRESIDPTVCDDGTGNGTGTHHG